MAETLGVHSIQAERDHFKRHVAPELFRKAGLPVERELTPVRGGEHSQRLAFLTDGRRAGIALRAGEDVSHSIALAHAVHHAGDRPLVLMVPKRRPHGSAAQCIPWMVQEIEVWEYGPDLVPQRVPTGQDDALSRIPADVVNDAHDLKERASWIEPLLTWVSSRPELEEASRQSVRAWHVHGRSALRLTRTRDGLSLSAGVNYSKPRTGKPLPIEAELTSRISDDLLEAVVSRIEEVISNRLDGKDDENEEHRFQAWLTRNFGRIGLAAPPLREFPSYRNGRRAYIDLLGIDVAKRLRVIETKIDDADDLILQGLEYWIWTRRCVQPLTREVHFDPDQLPCIDYVILREGASASPLGGYSRTLLKRLHPSVRWRVHLATRGTSHSYDVTSLPERQLP